MFFITKEVALKLIGCTNKEFEENIEEEIGYCLIGDEKRFLKKDILFYVEKMIIQKKKENEKFYKEMGISREYINISEYAKKYSFLYEEIFRGMTKGIIDFKSNGEEIYIKDAKNHNKLHDFNNTGVEKKINNNVMKITDKRKLKEQKLLYSFDMKTIDLISKEYDGSIATFAVDSSKFEKENIGCVGIYYSNSNEEEYYSNVYDSSEYGVNFLEVMAIVKAVILAEKKGLKEVNILSDQLHHISHFNKEEFIIKNGINRNKKQKEIYSEFMDILSKTEVEVNYYYSTKVLKNHDISHKLSRAYENMSTKDISEFAFGELYINLENKIKKLKNLNKLKPLEINEYKNIEPFKDEKLSKQTVEFSEEKFIVEEKFEDLLFNNNVFDKSEKNKNSVSVKILFKRKEDYKNEFETIYLNENKVVKSTVNSKLSSEAALTFATNVLKKLKKQNFKEINIELENLGAFKTELEVIKMMPNQYFKCKKIYKNLIKECNFSSDLNFYDVLA